MDVHPAPHGEEPPDDAGAAKAAEAVAADADKERA